MYVKNSPSALLSLTNLFHQSSKSIQKNANTDVSTKRVLVCRKIK